MEMSTRMSVAEEQRTPFLNGDTDRISVIHSNEDAVSPLSSDNTDKPIRSPNQRLISLDVFRGLTVAVRF